MSRVLIGFFSPQIVDLDPPHPEASLFELQLRESLLNSIASYPNVSENQAHTYMNGTSDVVHTYCKMFDKSLEVSPSLATLSMPDFDSCHLLSPPGSLC